MATANNVLSYCWYWHTYVLCQVPVMSVGTEWENLVTAGATMTSQIYQRGLEVVV